MATSPDREQLVVHEVRDTDPEFEFYHQWSLEARKGAIPFTNDVLRQLMTLAVTLLGGGVAFLDDKAMPAGFRGLALLV